MVIFWQKHWWFWRWQRWPSWRGWSIWSWGWSNLTIPGGTVVADQWSPQGGLLGDTISSWVEALMARPHLLPHTNDYNPNVQSRWFPKPGVNLRMMHHALPWEQSRFTRYTATTLLTYTDQYKTWFSTTSCDFATKHRLNTAGEHICRDTMCWCGTGTGTGTGAVLRPDRLARSQDGVYQLVPPSSLLTACFPSHEPFDTDRYSTDFAPGTASILHRVQQLFCTRYSTYFVPGTAQQMGLSGAPVLHQVQHSRPEPGAPNFSSGCNVGYYALGLGWETKHHQQWANKHTSWF